MRPVRPHQLVAAAVIAAAAGLVVWLQRPQPLAVAVARLPRVEGMAPGVQGDAEVSAVGRTRRISVFGTDTQLLQVWNAKLALGRPLPADNPRTTRAFAALGTKLRSELFGIANPLGRRLRIGGETFRVIGVLAAQGQLLGFDLDDAAYIPAGRAVALFNREKLMEIDARYAGDVSAGLMADRIRRMLVRRHGTEDFTITSQEDMLGILTASLPF